LSEIRANTVSNAAGTGPATLTGQYAAKAWVNFDGTGTVAIRDSFNISSLADNGTGVYTITFTNAFSDANYAPPSMTRNNYVLGKFGTETASTLGMENRTNGGSETDSVYVTVAAVGDLA
jgi:hypothetical protein